MVFKKWKKNRQENLDTIMPVIINGDSKMIGDFVFSTDLKIEGHVEGNIATSKSVIIGDDGYLKGSLKCNILRVYGVFEGSSEVADTTFLYCNSRYEGRLNSASITVIPGGCLNALVNAETSGADFVNQFVRTESTSLNSSGKDDTSQVSVSDSEQEKSPVVGSFLLNNLKK